MRRKLVLVSVLFLCLSAFPVSSFAWNDLGHMTVARIAFLRLTDAERMSVVSILHHHPHLRELLLKDRPKSASEEEWLFINAATWPDRVRPPHIASREPVKSHPVYRFHHPTWHYANWEFEPGHISANASHPSNRRSKPVNQMEQTNIIDELDQSFRISQGAERERSEPEAELDPLEIRAIRVCWLMHLMGDIHQPLHVIDFVDHRIPALEHGDEGGNKLGVRINHSTAPRKLHALWDDMLGTHPQFEKVVQLADILYRDPRNSVAESREYIQHRQAHEFAQESYQIARDAIYLNGSLHFALWSRIESHEIANEDVPVLSQHSVDQAHALAQRQILLAGYRLADRLKLVVYRDVNRRASESTALPPM